MEKSIEITSVKLLKQREGNGIVLGTIERDSRGDQASCDKDHTAPVHPDLEKALIRLAPHYAKMTGQTEDRVYVSGYSISSKGKTSGIMLTGHYLNFRDKAVIANTPFEAFISENVYPEMDQLEKEIKKIDKEVRAYLDGTKRGGQQELELKQPELEMEGNTYPNGQSHASPEAMKRLAADTDFKEKPNKRKAKQTANNPSGAAE